ncbi:hypothetical protein NT90_04100 [Acinetobacter baumannii]|nr:hypothetical protein NT90_04100 [Acinetobacter baumannii]
MDKCREEFEQSLERTDGFHDGYVTWNEASSMYMANDDGYECMADWMNGAFAIHRKMQAKVEWLQTQLSLQRQRVKAFEEELTNSRNYGDELQKRVDELETAFKHLIKMNNKSISYEHDLFDKGWNQCAETTIRNIYSLTGLGEQALKGEG